jgi:hypothetical protein
MESKRETELAKQKFVDCVARGFDKNENARG